MNCKGKGKVFQDEWPSFVVHAFGNSRRDESKMRICRTRSQQSIIIFDIFFEISTRPKGFCDQ
jgi:hypothetical protein